jgi:hypothetical protein
MATDKKHIAVYLAPEIEQALIAFCEQNGLISKKGTMYSAGVNAALAAFFGIAATGNIPQRLDNIPPQTGNILNPTLGNIPPQTGNIPQRLDNIPPQTGNILNPTLGNIPNDVASNIPAKSIDVEVLPGKLRA